MQKVQPDRFRYSKNSSDIGKLAKSSSEHGDLAFFGIKNYIKIYRKSWIFLDFPDSPTAFGATSTIVSGWPRVKKADVKLVQLFSLKIFDL